MNRLGPILFIHNGPVAQLDTRPDLILDRLVRLQSLYVGHLDVRVEPARLGRFMSARTGIGIRLGMSRVDTVFGI